MRILTTISILMLCGAAFPGELYQRYEAWRAHPDEKPSASKPAAPSEIVTVGIERTTDFYMKYPAYEVVLDARGGVRYRGTGRNGLVGEFTGAQTDTLDFTRLAEYICNSDFFELADEFEMKSSHHPDCLLFVWTTQGEKWVLDRNSPDQLHSTVWGIGKMIDGILFNAALERKEQVRLTADLASAPLSPGFPKLSEKLQKGNSVRLVCFGDSVTGLYYHTGGRRAYTDVLKLTLEQLYPGVPFTAFNAGASGNTTADALLRIDTDVLAHGPDIVTVMFGLNDMTRESLEDYRANLNEIVNKCQAAGAEVLLCTPNAVEDTSSRPTDKLLQYVGVVREIAAARLIPLADCYAAMESVREKRLEDWIMLMSDEIHPNMAGHRALAGTMATAISERRYMGFSIGAPEPAIPRTLALIGARQPIRILAMPPYDKLLPLLLQEMAPDSEISVRTWETAGKSMAEIEADAKSVRDNPPDLVFIAVPIDAPAADFDEFKRHFTWTMNWSLSFGRQEWDVVAVPPSFTGPVEGEAAERDAWQKKLIRAQDFEVLSGGANPLDQRVREWLAAQLAQGD